MLEISLVPRGALPVPIAPERKENFNQELLRQKMERLRQQMNLCGEKIGQIQDDQNRMHSTASEIQFRQTAIECQKETCGEQQNSIDKANFEVQESCLQVGAYSQSSIQIVNELSQQTFKIGKDQQCLGLQQNGIEQKQENIQQHVISIQQDQLKIKQSLQSTVPLMQEINLQASQIKKCYDTIETNLIPIENREVETQVSLSVGKLDSKSFSVLSNKDQQQIGWLKRIQDYCLKIIFWMCETMILTNPYIRNEIACFDYASYFRKCFLA
jgi:chromosome segregation ATPase